MNKKHKTKLIFTSKTAGTIVVEEEAKSDKSTVVQNVSTTLSLNSFPTAKLELKLTARHGDLISVKSGDQFELQVCEIGSTYSKLFKGKLSSVKVKAKKDEFELSMESVSEFYDLQIKHISSQNFKTKKGLREILQEVVDVCGIDGTIKVDSKISNDFSLTPFKSFPALSFINSICYSRDLVYDFNKGDIMSFSRRSDVINKMNSSTPIVINDDQIINSSLEQ